MLQHAAADLSSCVIQPLFLDICKNITHELETRGVTVSVEIGRAACLTSRVTDTQARTRLGALSYRVTRSQGARLLGRLQRLLTACSEYSARRLQRPATRPADGGLQKFRKKTASSGAPRVYLYIIQMYNQILTAKHVWVELNIQRTKRRRPPSGRYANTGPEIHLCNDITPDPGPVGRRRELAL